MAKQDYPYVPGDYGNQKMYVSMLREAVVASAIVTAVSDVFCKEGVRCTVWMEDQLSMADKAILDGLIASYDVADWPKFQTTKMLRDKVLPNNYVAELTMTSTADGLVVTTTIDELDIEDQTTVVADTSLTKYVLLSLCYSDAEGIHVEAFEKTDGMYDLLALGDYLIQQDISEWSVVANGDTLVKVE